MDALVTAARPRTLPSRADRRADRRRLARCDAVSARLAELHAIGAVLTDAAELVGHGWVQNAWFSVGSLRGERLLTAYDVRHTLEQPVTGACLVGSIVHSSGAPATSQLVQRTLDLTWHALRDDSERPMVLCPAPPVRAMRLRDLTRWNDRRGRSQGEVVDLLHRTRDLADRHGAAYRTEQAALTTDRSTAARRGGPRAR
jgi:hypothetical protein